MCPSPLGSRLPLAIVHQSYGRFGGAERVALAHYEQLRKMNVDATLFWSGLVTTRWQDRLNGYDIKSIPSTLPGPIGIGRMIRFLKEQSRYDTTIINHHVARLLTLYISPTQATQTLAHNR